MGGGCYLRGGSKPAPVLVDLDSHPTLAPPLHGVNNPFPQAPASPATSGHIQCATVRSCSGSWCQVEFRWWRSCREVWWKMCGEGTSSPAAAQSPPPSCPWGQWGMTREGRISHSPPAAWAWQQTWMRQWRAHGPSWQPAGLPLKKPNDYLGAGFLAAGVVAPAWWRGPPRQRWRRCPSP